MTLSSKASGDENALDGTRCAGFAVRFSPPPSCPEPRVAATRALGGSGYLRMRHLAKILDSPNGISLACSHVEKSKYPGQAHAGCRQGSLIWLRVGLRVRMQANLDPARSLQSPLRPSLIPSSVQSCLCLKATRGCWIGGAWTPGRHQSYFSFRIE